MADCPVSTVTRLVHAAGKGDSQAAAKLLPMVYAELRKLARVRLSKMPPGNTLQPTALVHEAYLRLVGREDRGWTGRGHFFAAAAEAMRQILVDRARRKQAAKRGGRGQRMSIDDSRILTGAPSVDLLDLQEALERLEDVDPRKARIVVLRFLGGLSHSEIAEVLGVSVPTIEREWRFARVFLYHNLHNSPSLG